MIDDILYYIILPLIFNYSVKTTKQQNRHKIIKWFNPVFELHPQRVPSKQKAKVVRQIGQLSREIKTFKSCILHFALFSCESESFEQKSKLFWKNSVKPNRKKWFFCELSSYTKLSFFRRIIFFCMVVPSVSSSQRLFGDRTFCYCEQWNPFHIFL